MKSHLLAELQPPVHTCSRCSVSGICRCSVWLLTQDRCLQKNMLSYLNPSLWVKKKTQSLPRRKAVQNCSSAIVQKHAMQHCSPVKQDFENPLIHKQLQIETTTYRVRVLLTLCSSWTASNNARQVLQSSFFHTDAMV